MKSRLSIFALHLETWDNLIHVIWDNLFMVNGIQSYEHFTRSLFPIIYAHHQNFNPIIELIFSLTSHNANPNLSHFCKYLTKIFNQTTELICSWTSHQTIGTYSAVRKISQVFLQAAQKNICKKKKKEFISLFPCNKWLVPQLFGICDKWYFVDNPTKKKQTKKNKQDSYLACSL